MTSHKKPKGVIFPKLHLFVLATFIIGAFLAAILITYALTKVGTEKAIGHVIPDVPSKT
jgi:hypothetical protein